MKACPFCGGPGKLLPVYASGTKMWTAFCGASSYCASLTRTTEAAALAAWNRRDRPARRRLRGLLDRLLGSPWVGP